MSASPSGSALKFDPSKMPVKSSLRRTNTLPRGEVIWDEANIIRNEAMAGKEYGTMKITEPKTPYHSEVPVDAVCALDLNAKLAQASSSSASPMQVDNDSEDEEDEPDSESARKFKKERASHYRMGDALRRKVNLVNDDDEDDDDEESNSYNDQDDDDDDDDDDADDDDDE